MERLASDTVEGYRATVTRSGGPRSRLLRLPDAVGASAGDVVRVSLDDDGRTTNGFARADADAKGPYLAGVYANRRLARTDGEGEDLLAPLLAECEPGTSLVVDVLDPDHHYGVRRPGERVVYEVPERRDDSLASIAEQFEEPE